VTVPGVWPAKALDNLQSGGLARAVRPENPEKLTQPHLEAHTVDREHVSVGLP
jgi:hypothetical protein